MEVFSLSKGWNMTGWRTAAVVGNPEAVEAYWRLKTNIDSGMFEAVQLAAATALDAGPPAGMTEVYTRRRDLVCGALAAIGVDVDPPRGTIYVWAPVPEGHDSASFCELVLEESGVAVSPGGAYGPNGEGFFRISLTVADERLRRGRGAAHGRAWGADGALLRRGRDGRSAPARGARGGPDGRAADPPERALLRARLRRAGGHRDALARRDGARAGSAALGARQRGRTRARRPARGARSGAAAAQRGGVAAGGPAGGRDRLPAGRGGRRDRTGGARAPTGGSRCSRPTRTACSAPCRVAGSRPSAIRSACRCGSRSWPGTT